MTKVLFDSHALVWYLQGDRRFSRRALSEIEEGDLIICVSAVTAWEVANKVRIGKWPEAAILARNFDAVLTRQNVEPLPITFQHARLAGFLPSPHRDPFDRMLAAQAQFERLPLVTADPVFGEFDVQVLW